MRIIKKTKGLFLFHLLLLQSSQGLYANRRSVKNKTRKKIFNNKFLKSTITLWISVEFGKLIFEVNPQLFRSKKERNKPSITKHFDTSQL